MEAVNSQNSWIQWPRSEMKRFFPFFRFDKGNLFQHGASTTLLG